MLTSINRFHFLLLFLPKVFLLLPLTEHFLSITYSGWMPVSFSHLVNLISESQRREASISPRDEGVKNKPIQFSSLPGWIATPAPPSTLLPSLALWTSGSCKPKQKEHPALKYQTFVLVQTSPPHILHGACTLPQQHPQCESV